MAAQIPTIDQEAELWTAAEVARYLKVSRSWVYRETGAGRLPCSRILGLVRYDPAEIRRMKEEGRQRPAAVILPLVPRTT
jgi:predicted DNA-binding transcriptional regulator AlpA